jgi:hypothetical protein
METPEINRRKFLSQVLQASVIVAKHERDGPADYVNISKSASAELEMEDIAGIKVYVDDELKGYEFTIGRSHDGFEIKVDDHV